LEGLSNNREGRGSAAALSLSAARHPIASTGRFRRTHEQSPHVLKRASQATPFLSARLAALGLLCCALVFTARAAAAVRESAFVERATTPYRVGVNCYAHREWAKLVDTGYPELKGHEADVYGLWRYERRELALPARGCLALEHWRTARASRLGVWIFVLGHELTHVQQSDLYGAPWDRAFDEAEADCGGYAKFESVRLALGIRRVVSPPPRSFARCSAKRAKQH
jgi:hypothetical protein